MNALAHRITSGTRTPLRAVVLPRAARMLGLAMIGTTVVMTVLERLSHRIG